MVSPPPHTRIVAPQNDTDSGSDSSPSEDNLDPKEIAAILPAETMPAASAPPKSVIAGSAPAPPPARKDSTKPFRRRLGEGVIVRRGANKRSVGQYVELVDSWTQTTPRGEEYHNK